MVALRQTLHRPSTIRTKIQYWLEASRGPITIDLDPVSLYVVSSVEKKTFFLPQRLCHSLLFMLPFHEMN